MGTCELAKDDADTLSAAAEAPAATSGGREHEFRDDPHFDPPREHGMAGRAKVPQIYDHDSARAFPQAGFKSFPKR